MRRLVVLFALSAVVAGLAVTAPASADPEEPVVDHYQVLYGNVNGEDVCNVEAIVCVSNDEIGLVEHFFGGCARVVRGAEEAAVELQLWHQGDEPYLADRTSSQFWYLPVGDASLLWIGTEGPALVKTIGEDFATGSIDGVDLVRWYGIRTEEPCLAPV